MSTMSTMMSPKQEYTVLFHLNRSPQERRLAARGKRNPFKSRPSGLAIPYPPQPSRKAAALAKAATERSLICANCGQKDHELRQCVSIWSEAGDIDGCYRCNKIDHIIDDCPQLPRIRDLARYEAEVLGRAGRPPIRSRRGWNELAVTMSHIGPGPISRQAMAGLPRTHFQKWNYLLPWQEQRELLVPDAATANLDAIRVLEDQAYKRPSHPNDMRGRNRIDNRAPQQRNGPPPAQQSAHAEPETQDAEGNVAMLEATGPQPVQSQQTQQEVPSEFARRLSLRSRDGEPQQGDSQHGSPQPGGPPL
ncbi:hypothetical protein F5Y05DRAFT_384846 [Hypoxylon sp. FL0543]|nr:hypothetical protein F5Y05DRAFT_384846 [Hypoxylon sp. FL0543]